MKATRDQIERVLADPYAHATQVAPDAVRAYLAAHGCACVWVACDRAWERWEHADGGGVFVLERKDFADYAARVLDAVVAVRRTDVWGMNTPPLAFLDLADLWVASTTNKGTVTT